MKKALIMLVCIAGRLFAQELLMENNLYYEKPNYSSDNIGKYTMDNSSYKQGRILIYDYYYIDKQGGKKKFIKTDKVNEQNPLHLADYASNGDSVIDKIKLYVDDELGNNGMFDSTYTQTIIGYEYMRKGSDFNFPDEITGAIDNSKNVWIHPPRSYTFKILELNPFPFYYYDEKVRYWTWKLDVGGPHYMDYRWISAKGPLQINYDYVRYPDEIITTAAGTYTCKVVCATAFSDFDGKMMRTKLKSYFHADLGFVKLVYDNINGSRLFLELIEMKQLNVRIPSKAPTLAVYHQTCCPEYFTEELSLLTDSSFKYSYNNRSLKENRFGKWKMFGDTLVLYDYSNEPKKLKILTGEESFDPLLVDSIRVSFKTPNEDRILPRIYVNGKCVKFWNNRGSHYIIHKKNVTRIELRDAVYNIIDTKANSLVINYEPNWTAAKDWRVNNISRCLVRNGTVIRLDCDNTLDFGFSLPKK